MDTQDPDAPVRVLVVEDSPSVLMYLELLFKDAHFDVATALDGEGAYARAVDWNPHLVVTDIAMPSGDGYELLGRLRETVCTAHIPVIMLTASDPSPRAASRYEPHALIPKSSTAVEILSAATRVLARAAQPQ